MFFNHDMNKSWNIINSFKIVLFYFFLNMLFKKIYKFDRLYQRTIIVVQIRNIIKFDYQD